MPVSTVVIVDDHPIFRKGLMQLINASGKHSVVGDVAAGADSLPLIETARPDLVIVDLNLGDEDGLDLIKDLKFRYPELAMMVLSMHDERYYAERALRAGARGYVMKDEVGNRIIEAIETVLAGGVWLSERERDRLLEARSMALAADDGEEGDLDSLSDRQLRILTLIGKGLGTVEIAARLKLSPKTVGTHKEHLKRKLGCASIRELRELAIRLVVS